MNTLKDFIEQYDILFEIKPAASNPNMDENWPSRHFTCTFANASGDEMTVPFSQGLGLKDEPTAEDVLDCLASDASFIEGNDFEDWCHELGYNEDSRKAYATYLACAEASDELEQFLGSEGYQQLLWDTERL